MTVTFMMEKQVFRGHTVKFLAKKWCDGVVLATGFVLQTVCCSQLLYKYVRLQMVSLFTSIPPSSLQ